MGLPAAASSICNSSGIVNLMPTDFPLCSSGAFGFLPAPSRAPPLLDLAATVPPSHEYCKTEFKRPSQGILPPPPPATLRVLRRICAKLLQHPDRLGHHCPAAKRSPASGRSLSAWLLQVTSCHVSRGRCAATETTACAKRHQAQCAQRSHCQTRPAVGCWKMTA